VVGITGFSFCFFIYIACRFFYVAMRH